MSLKRGFTLAEIIISVGIIAVIAAVMLPMVNKFKPDKEKVLYLKVHDAISEAIGDMASNPNVFPTEQNDSYFVNSPLFNTEARGGYAGGNGKICRILAESLGATQNACSDAYAEFNEAFSFVLPNGVHMYVSTNRAVNSETVGTLRTDVVFDVNGPENGQNCFAETCAKPDRFKLIVGSQGQIIPADEVGEYYLTHRANWKLKSNYELAGFPEFTVADATVSITQKPQDPPPGDDEIPGGGGDEGGDDDDGDQGGSPSSNETASAKNWNLNQYIQLEWRRTDIPGSFLDPTGDTNPIVMNISPSTMPADVQIMLNKVGITMTFDDKNNSIKYSKPADNYMLYAVYTDPNGFSPYSNCGVTKDNRTGNKGWGAASGTGSKLEYILPDSYTVVE